ncbi:helix-turn-helix transcriptional regulator [Notoacmeibacter sp. MSK16QG-6]|uniref:ArsR/SmtB family transcription factor n=1 Tax=Notoacmeibacter sp. MSK16QG-6 TaxID=2957982 RepID=UPI00209F8A25|nr:helix-turn-helix domain-containing protein [Notoacmeibacter sp. MSK16QG-6]MCP1199237.1 helix-turn-helix domain-containing protein [Notoacmeibacter sp. MSK16QG-6]
MDDVFRALADPARRAILDRLFLRNGQTLGELTNDADMSRQGLSKHLRILEDANLISVHWHGREKRHYLNPMPIAEIVHRWVGKFEDARLENLADIKRNAERKEKRHG